MPTPQISTFEQLRSFITTNFPDNNSGLVDPEDIRVALRSFVDIQTLRNDMMTANLSPEQAAAWQELIGKLDQIQRESLSGIKGIATQANAPTAYDVVTYPNGLFETYVVRTPVTSPNSWGGITVSSGELINNLVYLDVKNGVVSKSLVNIGVDLAIQKYLKPSETVAGAREPTLTADASGVFGIILNSPVTKTTKITRIEGNFPKAGTLKLVSLNNKRPHPTTPDHYLFDSVKSWSVVVTSFGDNTILDVSALNIDVEAGQYLGFEKTSTVLPTYGTRVGSSGWFSTNYPMVPTATVLINPTASMDIEFIAEDDIYVLKSDSESIKYTRVVVTRNGADYNSIREKIAELKPTAIGNKHYEIYVPKGEWFESDIFETGDNIRIVGEDCLNTVLYCDGLSTKTVPANYSFIGEAGKALNVISQIFKHVVNARGNIQMKDLTIRVNDSKYCAHLDSLLYKYCKFENVRFQTLTTVNNPVGIGLNGGQLLQFHSCEFDITSAGSKWKSGIFFHNWNNQSEGCRMEVYNSYFKCNYLILDELGSDYRDTIEFLGNDSEQVSPTIVVMVDKTGAGTTFWTNGLGAKETDPTKVPYNIFLNATGTRLSNIIYTPYDGVDPRPLVANYIRGVLNS